MEGRVEKAKAVAAVAAKVASQAPEQMMLCKEKVETQVTKEIGVGLSTELWKPMALVALQVWVMMAINKEFKGQDNVWADVSIYCPIVMTFVYLGGLYFGRKIMANRDPMVLKDYMFMYNLYQTVLNMWWVGSCIHEVYQLGMPIWGAPLDTSSRAYNLGFLIWVHYNNKYIELLDTLFMVLRKKEKQISFLHCYHHLLLFWSWFLVCKYGCGGDAYFGALMNSTIHVVMYGYYLSALLKVRCPWKSHITKLQMLQFVVCLSHAIFVLNKGNYPRWLTYLEVWVMLNMLVLFGNFYIKSYRKKKENKKQRELAKKEN